MKTGVFLTNAQSRFAPVLLGLRCVLGPPGLAHYKCTVCLFGSQECPKKRLTRNHRQNCRIGQPSAKKWFFSPDQFGPWPERKGKSGEIRSLLETLGGTLYPRKKLYLPKSYMDYNFCYKKILVRPTLLGGPLVKLGRISTIAPRREGAIKICY